MFIDETPRLRAWSVKDVFGPQMSHHGLRHQGPYSEANSVPTRLHRFTPFLNRGGLDRMPTLERFEDVETLLRCGTRDLAVLIQRQRAVVQNRLQSEALRQIQIVEKGEAQGFGRLDVELTFLEGEIRGPKPEE